MNSSPTRDPLDVIEEAAMLWPHNQEAIEDTNVEMAVLVALGKPHDSPMNTALVRRGCSHSETVRSLFGAMFGKAQSWSSYDFFKALCDRCLRDVQPCHSLWVPAGASVVEVHCCQRCREELDADFRTNDGKPLLVWD